jgi:hypothetical protein
MFFILKNKILYNKNLEIIFKSFQIFLIELPNLVLQFQQEHH